MPPDRFFGHILKTIKEKEIILESEEYLDIFSKYATTVLRVGEVVEIYDWQNETSKYIKPPGHWHFAFSKMKRMILTKSSKGTVLIRGEIVYNSDSGVGKPVTKKTKSIENMKPTKIPKQNVVNNKKEVEK